MKNIKLKSFLLQVVVLVVVLLLFTECRRNNEFERGVNTFVATFFFIIFMIIGGVPSIVFSALSINSTANSMKVLAIVFVSIFGLFCFIALAMYSEFWYKGAKEWISILAFIQFGSLVTSIVFIALGANNRAKLKAQNFTDDSEVLETSKKVPQKPSDNDDEIDYMDEILND